MDTDKIPRGCVCVCVCVCVFCVCVCVCVCGPGQALRTPNISGRAEETWEGSLSRSKQPVARKPTRAEPQEQGRGWCRRALGTETGLDLAAGVHESRLLAEVLLHREG